MPPYNPYPVRVVKPAAPAKTNIRTGIRTPPQPQQTFQGAPGVKSPDSPNYSPGVGAVVLPHVATNPKTGVGTIKKGRIVAAPRPNTGAGKLSPTPAPPVSKPGKQTGTKNPTATPPVVKQKPAATPTPTGGGGGGNVGVSTGYTPMTPGQLSNLARKMTQPEINTLTQVYKDAISQAQAQGASHDQAVQNLTSALQTIYKSVPTDVSNLYGHAADAVAGYASGFSNQDQQLKTDAGATASGFNPNLSTAQQAEIAKSYTGTPYDVNYGIHGFDPATTLRGIGAGLAANETATLPGLANAYGNQWLASNRDTTTKAVQGFQQQLEAAAAQYPQLFNTNLSNLATQDRQNQSIQLTRDAMGERNRATEAGITGIDPVTGQPTLAARKAARASALAEKKYALQIKNAGISDDRFKLSYAKWLDSKASKQAYGGLSATSYKTHFAKALGAARHYHKQWTDLKGNSQPPLTWQEYLTHGEAAGIPPFVLIKAGKQVYNTREIHEGLIPGAPDDRG